MIVFLSRNLAYSLILSFFFFNDTATTEIYTLSLHDALPISEGERAARVAGLDEELGVRAHERDRHCDLPAVREDERSEEHTSELQSQSNLVCRLLLEKKKKTSTSVSIATATT